MTNEQIRAAVKDYYDHATPEQITEMMAAQRESWMRAMAPCEHGDPDWETCPECLKQVFPTRPPPANTSE